MVGIYTTQHQKCPWKQCFPVLIYTMRCLTVNVYYVVVLNVQLLLLYPVKRQIEMQKTHVQQYIFMSTYTYHVVYCMTDDHTNNAQHGQCVPQCLDLILPQNYTHRSILCC